MDAKFQSQLYRERDITARGKFSKSHLYQMVARGEFPRQVITTKRFARWGADVDDWFADPAAWIKANSQGIQEKTSEVAGRSFIHEYSVMKDSARVDEAVSISKEKS